MSHAFLNGWKSKRGAETVGARAPMRRRHSKNKQKWGGGAFNALPWDFLGSNVLKSLSPFAVKLLVDMESQYRGFNNGDLCAAWTLMKERGWRSRTTLTKAIRELIDVEVISLTRPGNRRRCALYALTIYDIDECRGKHDAAPTGAPSKAWRRHEPLKSIPVLQAEFRAKQTRAA
jgi:hypothetical protein